MKLLRLLNFTFKKMGNIPTSVKERLERSKMDGYVELDLRECNLKKFPYQIFKRKDLSTLKKLNVSKNFIGKNAVDFF
jgi:hypothetical protein